MAGVVQELLIVCICMIYFESSHKIILTRANAHCTSYTSMKEGRQKNRCIFRKKLESSESSWNILHMN